MSCILILPHSCHEDFRRSSLQPVCHMFVPMENLPNPLKFSLVGVASWRRDKYLFYCSPQDAHRANKKEAEHKL